MIFWHRRISLQQPWCDQISVPTAPLTHVWVDAHEDSAGSKWSELLQLVGELLLQLHDTDRE